MTFIAEGLATISNSQSCDIRHHSTSSTACHTGAQLQLNVRPDGRAPLQATSSGAAAAPKEAPQKRPAFYAQTPDGTRFSAGAFSDLHLSRPLLKACAALGYTHPTPIQVQYGFPKAMQGDVLDTMPAGPVAVLGS